MQKITPFLWFDEQAEEAARFYASVFDNSKIVSITRYDEAGAKASGRPQGTVMTVAFELDGQGFVALNGGPAFTFSPAISFVVNCQTQEEIDRLWSELAEGGPEEAQQCGWLQDKYGVSWQIVPAALGQWLGGEEPAKAQRVMQALLQMKKLDIETLEQAYAHA